MCPKMAKLKSSMENSYGWLQQVTCLTMPLAKYLSACAITPGRTKSGYAISDNAGFKVDLPDRSSFSPDAAWYMGQPTGMKFLEGAPIFAVEVRSDGDYGPRAEQEIIKKRRDYFAAGTLCVWDVDLLSPDVIKAYFGNDPDNPIIFRRGELADAGEAIPGWSLAVDDLFPEEQK